jgi:predicted phosphodiesterase
VLAGDIDLTTAGIRWARRAFPHQQIVYVAGNHEFYRADRAATLLEMKETAAGCNVHLLENGEVVIQTPNSPHGVRFLGCTLWTDFRFFGESMKQQVMLAGQNGLNDFRLIREGEEIFTPARSIALHEQSVAWLKDRLEAPFAGKTVVVTHHLPSARSAAGRFQDSLLTPCFASKLDDLFGKMALWIHGHTHDSFDYEANGTRVICNPRGYASIRGEENPDFNPALVIEI